MKVVNVILELLEWPSLELILGIVGTATGVLSLIVHFVRLQKEKPDLELEVTKCWHYLERRKNRQPTFNLELGLRIKNTGHYGTTLSKIEAVFHDGGKRYLMESDLFQTFEQVTLMPTLPVGNLWIGPHKTTDTGCVFRLEDAVIQQEVLKCSFILYHTHGKETFRVTSPFSLLEFRSRVLVKQPF